MISSLTDTYFSLYCVKNEHFTPIRMNEQKKQSRIALLFKVYSFSFISFDVRTRAFPINKTVMAVRAIGSKANINTYVILWDIASMILFNIEADGKREKLKPTPKPDTIINSVSQSRAVSGDMLASKSKPMTTKRVDTFSFYASFISFTSCSRSLLIFAIINLILK
ncbi:hypothetical protein BACPU_05300 [Bacillus pumilus]|nr:hypothetical protein BACPU_05300 [Bacillus pumilus]